MISPQKMAKLVDSFVAPLATASYELDGVVQETSFTTKITDTTIRILMILDNSVAGSVSNFKVFDSDGQLVCSSSVTFAKVAGKKQYMAFEVRMTERG